MIHCFFMLLLYSVFFKQSRRIIRGLSNISVMMERTLVYGPSFGILRNVCPSSSNTPCIDTSMLITRTWITYCLFGKSPLFPNERNHSWLWAGGQIHTVAKKVFSRSSVNRLFMIKRCLYYAIATLRHACFPLP